MKILDELTRYSYFIILEYLLKAGLLKPLLKKNMLKVIKVVI